MGFIAWLFVVYTLLTTFVNCETELQKQSEILDQLLSKRYDNRFRPTAINGSEGPVIDYINIFIRDIDIRDEDHTFQVQMTLRQEWHDPRLKYENLDGKIKSITLNDPSKLWVPDIFFSNDVKGYLHQMTTPNILLRVYPNGDVLLSTRMTIRLSCDDIQSHFLTDSIVCSVRLVSYGYTTDDLFFKWKQGDDAIQITQKLKIPNFTMTKYDLAWCTSKTNTGEYSCLDVTFAFYRHLTYYVINVYIPSIMFVLITWFAFWMNPKAIHLRLVFTAIPFTCMVIACLILLSVLPKTYHVTAIHMWCGNCLNFILSAFILVGVINNFRLEEQKISADELDSEVEKGSSDRNDTGDRGSKHKGKPWYRVIFSKECPRSRKYDYVARILFPSMFGLFNLVYWAWFFSQRDT